MLGQVSRYEQNICMINQQWHNMLQTKNGDVKGRFGTEPNASRLVSTHVLLPGIDLSFLLLFIEFVKTKN